MSNTNGVGDSPPIGLDWAAPSELATPGMPAGNESIGAMPPASSNDLLPHVELTTPALPSPPNRGMALEVLFQALGMQERQANVQAGMQSLAVKAHERQEINDKKMEEIQKNLEDMRSKGVLDGFLKAFKIFGLILGAIAAAATTALGAITGNPVLIAAGVILCAMAINSIISEASDGKYSIASGISELAKKCGASPEAAQWIGFAFEMAISVVGCVLSLGGGAAAAGAKAAETASKGVEVASQVSKVVQVTNKVTTIASGINEAGEGVVQGVSAGYEYKMTMSQATQKELEAVLERLNQASETETDFIKNIMTRSQELMENVKEIVQGNIATQTAVLNGTPPAMA